MKNILQLIIMFALLFIGKASAQMLNYSNYDWEQNPSIHKIASSEEALEELVLKEKHCVEFAYDSKMELMEYKLFHKITRVNSKSAIESNNKIYIQFNNSDFISHKARVISPKGKIVELSGKDIKEAVDEESKATYRFFALEGLEMGSEIEHLYLVKRNPRLAGVKETFQSNVKKKNVEYEIVSPSNILFKVKSYNGFPALSQDTSFANKNVLGAKVKEIPSLKEEVMAPYKSNLQYLVYKLDANTANNKRDIIAYGSIAENVYKNFMVPADQASVKKIKKNLDAMKIKFAKDEEDKIRTLEFYIKSNFSLVDHYHPSLSDLPSILDKKAANDEGMLRLFTAFLKEMKIDFQVIMTSERNETKFDPEFESFNFLTHYLVYFPSLNTFLDPKDPFTCLGFVNYNLTNNYGLYIKEVNLGGYNTGIGKIKFIEPASYDKSVDNIKAHIDLNKDILNPKITIERQMSGYYAQYYQPFYSYYSPEDKVKFNKLIMKDFIENVEINNVKVENEGKDYFGRKPFIIKSSFDDEILVQKAGDKYMIKVGEVIGRQMEMYQEEERKLPVENNFNRLYQRSITLAIPEGYKVVNPEVLNMDVYQEENGERTITFTSRYTLNNNIYTIDIDEYYKKISFKKDQFEGFRKVINAAADFNKVTLILQKN